MDQSGYVFYSSEVCQTFLVKQFLEAKNGHKRERKEIHGKSPEMDFERLKKFKLRFCWAVENEGVGVDSAL